MSKDKALRMALDALEMYREYTPDGNGVAEQSITAIKEALAQPEQEPVGKFAKFTDGIWREVTDGSAGVPLYTSPPQRAWQGLTDAQIIEHFKENVDTGSLLSFADGVRFAEAAHGIKENT